MRLSGITTDHRQGRLAFFQAWESSPPSECSSWFFAGEKPFRSSPHSSGWMSFGRLFLGRLLASSAGLRFAVRLQC
jgi:hypothetical protein